MGNVCKCHNEDGEEMSVCEAIRKYFLSFWYEALAMTFLVFVGCGISAHSDSVDTSQVGGFQVALGMGCLYTGLLYVVSHRSGGHVNPAVTLCYMLTGDCNIFESIAIFIGQFCGGMLGGFLLSAAFPDGASESIGANFMKGDWNNDEGYPRVALAEGICMFLVLTVYYEAGVNNFSLARTAQERRPVLAPVAIGFAYFAAYSFMIPLNGGSLNPAKTICTALWASIRDSDDTDKIWEDLGFFLVGQAIAVACQFFLVRLQRVKGFAADANDRDSGLRSNSMYMNNLEEIGGIDVEDAEEK